MRYDRTLGATVIKMATGLDDIPAGGGPTAGRLIYVRESAGGVYAGFPLCSALALRGVLDDDDPTSWTIPAPGVWRITAAVTRSDASSSTFLHHQIVFRRTGEPPPFLPAWDSCVEPPPELAGVASGFTPPVVWLGYCDRFDQVSQYVNHGGATPVDARGAMTFEYLGHNGDNSALGTGPWGPAAASSYPGPATTTYGPP